MNLKKVDEIVDKYKAEDSWLVMILQDIQKELNYLPVSALKHVAEKIKVPLSRVYNVATFYSSFSLTERGKHLIKVCDGTACHLSGAVSLKDEISHQLGITQGQTTEDKVFTLDVVICLGACALAPVMTIGEKYFGQMTRQKLSQMLNEYRNKTTKAVKK